MILAWGLFCKQSTSGPVIDQDLGPQESQVVSFLLWNQPSSSWWWFCTFSLARSPLAWRRTATWQEKNSNLTCFIPRHLLKIALYHIWHFYILCIHILSRGSVIVGLPDRHYSRYVLYMYFTLHVFYMYYMYFICTPDVHFGINATGPLICCCIFLVSSSSGLEDADIDFAESHSPLPPSESIQSPGGKNILGTFF